VRTGLALPATAAAACTITPGNAARAHCCCRSRRDAGAAVAGSTLLLPCGGYDIGLRVAVSVMRQTPAALVLPMRVALRCTLSPRLFCLLVRGAFVRRCRARRLAGCCSVGTTVVASCCAWDCCDNLVLLLFNFCRSACVWITRTRRCARYAGTLFCARRAAAGYCAATALITLAPLFRTAAAVFHGVYRVCISTRYRWRLFKSAWRSRTPHATRASARALCIAARADTRAAQAALTRRAGSLSFANKFRTHQFCGAG